MRDEAAVSAAIDQPQPAVDRPRRGLLRAVCGAMLGAGVTACGSAVALWTAGTARFMMPNVITEPPHRLRRFPRRLPARIRRNAVQGQVRRVGDPRQLPRPYPDLCPAHGVHASWVHHHVAGERAEIQVPVPRQRILSRWNPFRGPAPRALERCAIRLADDGR